MATVRLGRYEARQGHLPPVCMRCGTAASVYRKRLFVHSPWWIYLGIPLGVVPFFILAWYRSKAARVCVPLCSLHRNLWRWQQPALISACALLCVGFGFIPLVLADRGHYESARAGKIAVVASLALVAGVGLHFGGTILLKYLGIHATLVNTNSIILTGVAAEFVEALRVAHQLEVSEPSSACSPQAWEAQQ